MRDLVRIASQIANPLPPGKIDVEHGEVGRLGEEHPHRRREIAGLDDDESRLAERETDEREQVLVVVDDEDLHGSSFAGRQA